MVESEKKKQITVNEPRIGFHSHPSCFESLPNELLFIIVAHLSTLDLVQAFYGLNHRFNVIVCELIHHFTIPKETFTIDFDEYDLRITSAIEKICFDIELLPQIFPSTYFYPNLRSIVLQCSDFATIDLIVDCKSAESAIHSCLNVLHIYTILPDDWYNGNSFVDSKYRSKIQKNLPVEAMWQQLTCEAIARLSINSCSGQALLPLCTLAPNLTYLKIRQLVSLDDCPDFTSMSNLIPHSLFLKQLHIISTTNRLDNLHSIEKLIDCYQSSLEHLTLEISLNNRPDGYYLQSILEPCQNLKKLTFAFNYCQEDNEEIDILHEFQSNWWLDSHRPPVLIFCSNHNETWIVSMPCYLDDYIWFPINPQNWLVNKGQLDSPDICFAKQKSIRFSNNNRQLITLDLVQIIGHVFRTPKQELSIPHWGFVSPDLLIEQLISTRCRESILPMIYSLDLNSCNLDQLDAKTLIIWLLLAPNVKVLNICQGTTSAKIQLVHRLEALIEEDQRLKSILDAIEEVQVFYMFDSLNYGTKQHICQMYSNIFKKPVFRR